MERYVMLSVRTKNETESFIAYAAGMLSALVPDLVMNGYEISMNTGQFEPEDEEIPVPEEILGLFENTYTKAREILQQWGMTETEARNALFGMEKSGLVIRERK